MQYAWVCGQRGCERCAGSLVWAEGEAADELLTVSGVAGEPETSACTAVLLDAAQLCQLCAYLLWRLSRMAAVGMVHCSSRQSHLWWGAQQGQSISYSSDCLSMTVQLGREPSQSKYSSIRPCLTAQRFLAVAGYSQHCALSTLQGKAHTSK